MVLFGIMSEHADGDNVRSEPAMDLGFSALGRAVDLTTGVAAAGIDLPPALCGSRFASPPTPDLSSLSRLFVSVPSRERSRHEAWLPGPPAFCVFMVGEILERISGEGEDGGVSEKTIGEEGKNEMTGSSGGSACRLLIDEGEGRGEWFRAVTRAGGACVPLPGPRSTYVLSQGAKPWRTRHPFRIGVLLGTSPRLFIIKLLCFRHNE